MISGFAALRIHFQSRLAFWRANYVMSEYEFHVPAGNGIAVLSLPLMTSNSQENTHPRHDATQSQSSRAVVIERKRWQPLSIQWWYSLYPKTSVKIIDLGQKSDQGYLPLLFVVRFFKHFPLSNHDRCDFMGVSVVTFKDFPYPVAGTGVLESLRNLEADFKCSMGHHGTDHSSQLNIEQITNTRDMRLSNIRGSTRSLGQTQLHTITYSKARNGEFVNPELESVMRPRIFRKLYLQISMRSFLQLEFVQHGLKSGVKRWDAPSTRAIDACIQEIRLSGEWPNFDAQA